MSDERKHRDVPTSELLDFCGQDIPYSDVEAKNQAQEYEDELEKREPFDDIKRALDRHSRELRQINDVLNKLLEHKHDYNGDIVVDIRKTIERGF